MRELGWDQSMFFYETDEMAAACRGLADRQYALIEGGHRQSNAWTKLKMLADGPGLSLADGEGKSFRRSHGEVQGKQGLARRINANRTEVEGEHITGYNNPEVRTTQCICKEAFYR